ncbi:hypothetical protein CRG98_038435 [Punica granatum]|uniref:Uncharacterized protein n=1 Tax=Punica granatum TaxID=22663 RepID=A0A2I0IBW2_PUNGR|nr:hypothetical protein CRG98_038435 [Punica granatum]
MHESKRMHSLVGDSSFHNEGQSLFGQSIVLASKSDSSFYLSELWRLVHCCLCPFSSSNLSLLFILLQSTTKPQFRGMVGDADGRGISVYGPSVKLTRPFRDRQPPLKLLQSSASSNHCRRFSPRRDPAMPDGEATTVTLGGKGSALAPSSVFAVANGLAKVRVDSSAHDRLAASRSSPSATYQIPFPSQFTPEESRASLTVLLSKLVLSGASGTRPVLPELFSSSLNSRESLDFGQLDVTEEELSILEKSDTNLHGVCALLDHQSTFLSMVVDAVAALSCEAIKADVSVFNSVDAGDGFTPKDEIGVSSDMKVLLNGSKLVGKVEVEAVRSILKIHATLRKVVKSLHLEMRANLNSAVKVGKAGSGKDGAVVAGATALLPLASALQSGFY